MPEIAVLPPPATKDNVFIGIGHAVSKYPEWWGKQTVVLYDKLKFPKFTSEEKKLTDKIHKFLKNHEKTIGWTETGLQAIIFSVCIVKGYRYLKEPKKQISGITSPFTPHVDNTTAIIPLNDDIIMPPKKDFIPEGLRKWMRPDDISALEKAKKAAEEAVAHAQAEHKKLDAMVHEREEREKQKLLDEIEAMFKKRKK